MPTRPRYEEVEFIAKETGNWVFGVINFSTTPPTVRRDESCQSCHIGDPPHPLWSQYPGWPGSITTEYQLRATRRVAAWHTRNDPRVTAIPVYPYDLHHDRMAQEFRDALAMRHGEVLIESVMPDKPATHVKFARNLLCKNGGDWEGNIRERFPAWQMPSTMGDGEGGERNIHPDKNPQSFYGSRNNVRVVPTIAMYLVNYLVTHDERVRTMYEETENTDSAEFSWELHYAPETASALDELTSRVQIAFGLKGAKQIKYRRNIQADMFRNMLSNMQIKQNHLNYMPPKVCEVLDAG